MDDGSALSYFIEFVKVLLAGLATLVGVIIGRRSVKAKVEPPIPPVEVKPSPQFVTCEQCNLRHEGIDNRLAAGTRAFEAVRTKIDTVEKKMDANQHDVMTSIQKLNERLVPIVETCAENGAAIRILLGENLKPRTKT